MPGCHFEQDDPNCPYEPEFWIEGIGSSYGLLDRGFNPCVVADAGVQLLCYEHEDAYLNLLAIECFLPDVNGCGMTNSTSDESSPADKLVISPNPASDVVRMDLSGFSSSPGISISVYNSRGRLFLKRQWAAIAGETIDVSELTGGIYFVKVQDETGRNVAFSRFLKQ